MLNSLLLGTALIAATVVIQTVGLVLLAIVMTRMMHWFRLHRHDFGRTVAMVVTVLGLFVLHTIEVWLWAIAFLFVHASQNFGEALFLSTASFSTMGAGRVAAPGWDLLIALESVNGFILIGWSIAFLVGASTRYGPFKSGEHF
jgi:hypothetical protein